MSVILTRSSVISTRMSVILTKIKILKNKSNLSFKLQINEDNRKNRNPILKPRKKENRKKY
jgi:hypothetical protein